MISITGSTNLSYSQIIARTSVSDTLEAEGILHRCVMRSHLTRYGYVDDELVCMWGLIPPTALSDNAYLWLLTTTIIVEHKFLFIRYSQRWIEEALKIYPVLVGNVRIDNEPAKQWIKWLGAVFHEHEGNMIRFTISRKPNV